MKIVKNLIAGAVLLSLAVAPGLGKPPSPSGNAKPRLAQAEKSSEKPTAEKKAEPAQKPPPIDLLGIFKIHYATQVQSFAAQNLQFKNVVLVGDSITEGFDVTKYFPGRRVLNRGIGGDVIGNGLPADDQRGLLRRLDNSIYDCAATDVFVMIGINDLNSGRNVDTMEAGYREMLGKIKEHNPSIKVHVESLLPTRGDSAKQNAPVREFNRRLEKLASRYGYDFVNLHPLFTDGNGEMKAEYTPDGLHLTDAGYRVWRAEIEKAMKW